MNLSCKEIHLNLTRILGAHAEFDTSHKQNIVRLLRILKINRPYKVMYSFETFKLTIHDWVVFSNCPVCPKYSEMQWVLYYVCFVMFACFYLKQVTVRELFLLCIHVRRSLCKACKPDRVRNLMRI